MTDYVLDTKVISPVRRAERAPKIAAWLSRQCEDALYISVITLGEIERGIRWQEGRNPDFAADLRSWLDRTRMLFSDRIVEFSAEDALIWGRLSADLGHPGADLMIAAQAISREATIVTGNVTDFERTGARVFDPFGE
ncbi:MAG: type II toxin-antitoxin system VapC family toxin [Pseudomonadota bacterium]